MSTPKSSRSESEERGVSDAVGFILITAIVVSTIGVLLVFGGQATSDTQDNIRVRQAQNTLSEIDAETAAVAYISSNDTTASRVVDLGVNDRTQSAYYIRQDSSVRIEIRKINPNGSTGSVINYEEFKVGSLEYRSGDTRIAYQGGGVWRKQAGSEESRLVSPPEITYRTGVTGQRATLTAPIVTIDQPEQQLSSDSVRISRKNVSTTSLTEDSRIVNRRVHVLVTSPYYRAWGEYFEERVRGNTTTEYYNSNNTVRVKLGRPQLKFSFETGVVTSDSFSSSGATSYNGPDPRTDASLPAADTLIDAKISEYSSGGPNVATFGTIDPSNANAVQNALNNDTVVYATGYDNAGLTLNNDTLVINGDFDATSSGGGLNAQGQSSTVYINGRYTQAGNTEVGNVVTPAGPGGTPPQYPTGNASKLTIFTASGYNHKFTGNSNFVGNFYAAGSDIKMAGTPGREGTIVAKKFKLRGTADFRYGGTATFIVGEDLDERRIFYLHLSESKVKFEPK